MPEIPWFSSIPEAVSFLSGVPEVSIKSQSPVGGGCISTTSVLTLSDSSRVFLKSHSPDLENMFRGEAEGLSELARIPGAPRVPQVYCGGKRQDQSFLFMEFIEPGVKDSSFFENLGHALALLHRTGRSESCGFVKDNYIGASTQRNSQTRDWIDFFCTNRLEVQLKMARDRGLADERMTGLINKIMSHLDRYLIPCDDSRSSLLHGDLWSGNVICDTRGEAVIIDPAVYYGHREADLAMTELFGGFDSAFYGAYNETWPIEVGYSERRDLYNLYHMLNHLNIFGRSYTGSVLSIVQKYTS